MNYLEIAKNLSDAQLIQFATKGAEMGYINRQYDPTTKTREELEAIAAAIYTRFNQQATR